MAQYIAIYPDTIFILELQKIQYQLSDLYGEIYSPYKLHCTIRYWKDLSDNEKVNQDVAKMLMDFFGSYNLKKIETKISSFDLFDNKCLVLKLYSEELFYIQSKIDLLLQKLGIPKSDYEGYNPHITLGKNFDKLPDNSILNDKKVVFDNLSFIIKDGENHKRYYSRPLL